MKIKTIHQIKTDEEFLEKCRAIARAEARKRKAEAELDERIQKLKDRYRAKIDTETETMKDSVTRCHAYAEKHRERLLGKRAKSVKFDLGKWGFRESTPMSFLPGCNAKSAIEAIESNRVSGLGKLIKLTKKLLASEAKKITPQLQESIGVCFEKTDIFYVDPDTTILDRPSPTSELE